MKKVLSVFLSVLIFTAMATTALASHEESSEGITSIATGEEVKGTGMIDFDRPQPRYITESIAGGEWNYGVTDYIVFSYFWTPSYQNHASVKAGSAKVIKSGWKAKNVRAEAEDERANSGNKSYYDYK